MTTSLIGTWAKRKNKGWDKRFLSLYADKIMWFTGLRNDRREGKEEGQLKLDQVVNIEWADTGAGSEVPLINHDV